jgi:hypothetical protein
MGVYEIQEWLLTTLESVDLVEPIMFSRWGWPISEMLHFIGLLLLIGTVGMFDLRLLGVARRIPIGALHRLVPWGIAGYALNVITGTMFLATAPDQYLYNPAFHFKILFMAAAGLNVLAFYSGFFRRLRVLEGGEDVPAAAKFIAGASLCLWTGVIICGRLLTFYRPIECGPEGPTGLLATCFLIH